MIRATGLFLPGFVPPRPRGDGAAWAGPVNHRSRGEGREASLVRPQALARDYSRLALLDFGCGVRFTQSILNLGLPMG